MRFGKDLARIGDAFGRIHEQDMVVDPTLAYQSPIELSERSRKIAAAVAAKAARTPKPNGSEITPWWKIRPDNRNPDDSRWNT